MRDKNLYQKNLILEFLDITQKNNLLEMKSTQKSRNEWLRNKKKKDQELNILLEFMNYSYMKTILFMYFSVI